MEISLKPNETYATLAVIATSLIDIKATDKVRPGSYTVQLNSTIAFPVTINASSLVTPIDRTITGELSKINPSPIGEESIANRIVQSRPSYFTVIVKSYTLDEQFRDFWNTYGEFISLLGGGIPPNPMSNFTLYCTRNFQSIK